MKTSWFIIGGVIIAGISAILIFGGKNPAAEIAWPSGAIAANAIVTHDWENIDIMGGDVNHIFTLKNESNEPLVIKTGETSCMCTTAFVELSDGTTSAKFGMHNNSTWNGVVDPGDNFKVHVVFDPLAHGPQAVGPIQRSVYLTTSAEPDKQLTYTASNAGVGSVIELQTTGDVMYADDFEKQQTKSSSSYQSVLGDFAFNEVEHDFGVIKQSAGIIEYDFPFIYNGEEKIDVTGTPASCACTSAEISNSTLLPGDEGILTVSFDPNLHEEPSGRFFKTVSILANPTLDETPELKIWAEIDLDLGPEAYKLKEEHND
ncbi:DUF1573 domain-containing protein [Patescibacteria group bacterium]